MRFENLASQKRKRRKHRNAERSMELELLVVPRRDMKRVTRRRERTRAEDILTTTLRRRNELGQAVSCTEPAKKKDGQDEQQNGSRKKNYKRNQSRQRESDGEMK